MGARWSPGGAGGWNRPIPPGHVRCRCPVRREWWARLLARAGQGCCNRPCCVAPHAAITATREELLALRVRSAREGWTCPRCGAAIDAHQRGYECCDRATRALRLRKGRR
jgi:hypothetical protein